MLSKTLSTSAKVAALYKANPKLAEFCRALFPLLVAHADDHGRLPGDEFTVKMQVDPIAPRKLPDFVAALHVLHEVGLIAWYQVDDRKVIEIERFSEHQDLKGHDKRAPKLPPCPDQTCWIGRRTRGLLGEFGDTTKGKGSEEKLREPKGREGSPAEAVPPPATVLTFPTQGVEGASWALDEAQVSEWQGLYPSLDVRAEARKALAWVQANPGRKKTIGGMPKFLVGWLNRAVDDKRSAYEPAAKPQAPARQVQPMGIQEIRK